MTDNNERQSIETAPEPMNDNSVEEARRKLMAKLAAGAFAVPAMLASVSRSSANPSN